MTQMSENDSKFWATEIKLLLEHIAGAITNQYPTHYTEQSKRTQLRETLDLIKQAFKQKRDRRVLWAEEQLKQYRLYQKHSGTNNQSVISVWETIIEKLKKEW